MRWAGEMASSRCLCVPLMDGRQMCKEDGARLSGVMLGWCWRGDHLLESARVVPTLGPRFWLCSPLSAAWRHPSA